MRAKRPVQQACFAGCFVTALRMSDSSDAGGSSTERRGPEESPSNSDDPDFELLEAALAPGQEARCQPPSRQNKLFSNFSKYPQTTCSLIVRCPTRRRALAMRAMQRYTHFNTLET